MGRERKGTNVGELKVIEGERYKINGLEGQIWNEIEE